MLTGEFPSRIPDYPGIHLTYVDASSSQADRSKLIDYLKSRPDLTVDGSKVFSRLVDELGDQLTGWFVWQERRRAGTTYQYVLAAQLDCTPDGLQGLPTVLQTLPRVAKLGLLARKVMTGQHIINVMRDTPDFESINLAEPIRDLQLPAWMPILSGPKSLNDIIATHQMCGFRLDKVPDAIRAPMTDLLNGVPPILMTMSVEEAKRQRERHLQMLDAWARQLADPVERKFWRELILNCPWTIEVRICPHTGMPTLSLKKGAAEKTD